MALLERLAKFDTWPELESAAGERYTDALSLAVGPDDRTTGAVYLFGYVFEMLLKTAYYRFIGLSAESNVAPTLRGMPKKAKDLDFTWRGNRHNSQSLASLLVYERRVFGRPLDTKIAAELMGHASALSVFHWSESLRYKAVIATESELKSVYDSAEWIRANHNELWK